MQIKIAQLTLSIPVIGILITENKEDLLSVTMFRCQCGKELFQYPGILSYVAAGALPFKLPLIERCPRCKKNYAIYRWY